MAPTLVVAYDPAIGTSARRLLDRQIAAAANLVRDVLPDHAYRIESGDIGRVSAGAPAAGKVRDFLVAATLAQARVGPGDMLALGRSAGTTLGGGGLTLTVKSCGIPGAMRAMLEPPALTLTLEHKGSADRLAHPIAARLVAEVIANVESPEHSEYAFAPALRWLETSLASPGHATNGGLAADLPLQAWLAAWRGLALDDTARLEFARQRLDDLAHGRSQDVEPLARASMLADLALVCMALGGTGEGSRRLAEGLSAARIALSVLPTTQHPERTASIEALLGRIGGALGARHRDTRYLNDAIAAFQRAERLASSPWLEGACGIEHLADERHALEELRTRFIASRSNRRA